MTYGVKVTIFMKSESSSIQNRLGILYALLAYAAWGFFPLYWKLLKGVPHIEILMNRMMWCASFMVVLLVLREKGNVFYKLNEAKKYLKFLILSASFISLNWFIYIYAVNSNQVLESSLGYFMSPLVSTLLATLALHERLSRVHRVAIGLATVGVLRLTFEVGHVPYIALALSTSFGFYGLIRKKLTLEPLVASTLESLVQLFPALMILGFSETHFVLSVESQRQPFHVCLLILGGIVTGLPMLWFANAVKRLPLSRVSFFQYLSPTLQFLLAVLIFKEPFNRAYAEGFAFIWVALALYSMDLYRSTFMPRFGNSGLQAQKVS